MTLLLFGYRGSGKTTIGQRLSRRLGATFQDTDALVRERFGGLEVADIWATHGEPAFRAMEVAVTRELLKNPDRKGGDADASSSSGPLPHGRGSLISHRVIALGGGTLMQPEAFEAVKQADGALRVYLRAPASVLASRIATDKATAGQRPSLTGATNPTDEVAQVLAAREPTYLAAADKVLDISRRSVEDAVTQIMLWMEQADGR